IFPRLVLRMDLGPSDQVVHVARIDADALHATARDLACDLAAELPDLALQLADSRFARVAGDDLAQRGIRDLELLGREPVVAPQPGRPGTRRPACPPRRAGTRDSWRPPASSPG